MAVGEEDIAVVVLGRCLVASADRCALRKLEVGGERGRCGKGGVDIGQASKREKDAEGSESE